MTHAPPGRHELNGSASEGFRISHAIRMRQLTVHNVGNNFHILMRMGAKAAGGLDEVVVHDAENAVVGIVGIMVLGKTEMKARFQPVAVGPFRMIGCIGAIAKPLRRWFAYIEFVVGDNFDVGLGHGRHGYFG